MHLMFRQLALATVVYKIYRYIRKATANYIHVYNLDKLLVLGIIPQPEASNTSACV